MTAAPKPTRAKADPAYLALVRQLPCAVCWTDVDVIPHHAIDGRHSQARADDRNAIPLCPRCHRFRHDEPLRFRLTIASDGELVIRTRAAVERLICATIGGR